MKRILVLLLVFPSFIFAQKDKSAPLGNFYLENGSVIYHHVYIDSLDSASVITRKLVPYIATLPNVSNVVQSGFIITGNYDNLENETFASSELKCDFTIEIKNGKYRVTILNLKQKYSMTPSIFNTFENSFTRDNNTEWRVNAHYDIAGFDAKFTTLFMLPVMSGQSDW